MIKYRTGFYYEPIEKIEIFRETEKFVCFENGRKDAKRSMFYNYFDTFDEAKLYLVKRTIDKIDSLKDQLQKKEFDLEKIMNLEEKDA